VALTNKLGMPKVFERLVQGLDDQYVSSSSGRESYGVTTLGSAPWRIRLMKDHREEVEEDVVDRFFAFRGQMMHKALEDIPLFNVLPEVKVGMEVNGAWISGRIDVVGPGVIEDHKMQTVEAYWYMDDERKLELAKQLNPYRYMMFHIFGMHVNKLTANMYLMNWVARKAKFEKNYPKKPHFAIDVPVWTIDETHNYILDRIAQHRKPFEEMEPCSPAERWARPDMYALIAKDAKRATKQEPSIEALEKWMERNPTKIKKKSEIIKRPGGDNRCEGYCRVNLHCPYYIAKKALEIG